MTALFGKNKDNSLDSKSFRYALIGTLIACVVIVIMFVFIPVMPKQKHYKTVKITLSQSSQNKLRTEASAKSAPAQNSPATKTVPAPQTSQNQASESKPVVQKTAPAKPNAAAAKSNVAAAKSNVAAAKTASAKTASVPTSKPATAKPKAPVKYAKSVDDLMAQSTNTPKKEVKWDDSIFDDTEESVSTSSTRQLNNAKLSSESALTGTAASASNESEITAGKNVVTGKTVNNSVSSETTAAIGKIAAAKYTSQSAGGVSSEVSANTASSNGKVTMEMTDGSARILLEPKEPSIRISERNAQLIDSSRTVVIQFKVLAGGNVPLSEIQIKPAAVLPPEIRSEISEQIAKWRFAADDTDGTARFEYSIIRK